MRNDVRRFVHITRFAAMGLASLLILGACGSDNPSEGPASTTAATTTVDASAAACADVAALKASLTALTQVRPIQDGTDALKSAISEVRTNLDAALASASAALEPAVNDVKTSFDQLQTSVSGLTASNLRQKAPEILDALGQVTTASVALGTTQLQACSGS